MAALFVTALSVLIPLLGATLGALLVLLLPFQRIISLLILLAAGVATLVHIGLVGAVIAALAILAHDIFSYKYPFEGTREQRAEAVLVPDNAAK